MTWPTPHPDDQFSHVRPQDTDACTDYGTVHSIESQVFAMGMDIQYSERALATLSGTTPQGNFLEKVFMTVKQDGLIQDSLWPEPATFTWNEYYQPVPPDIIATGKQFLEAFDVSYTMNIPESQISEALKVAPLLVVITGMAVNHIMEMVDENTLFDSYPHGTDGTGPGGYLLTLDQLHKLGLNIASYHQIVIKRKNNSMIEFAHKTNTPEYGFLETTPYTVIFHRAIDEQDIKFMATKFGVNVLNPDGSVNFALAREITI